MRKLLITLLTIILIVLPVCANDLEIPEAPSSAHEYMPHSEQSFAQGVIYILVQAIKNIMPDVAEGIRAGLLLISASMAASFISCLNSPVKRMSELVAVIYSATVLLSSTNSLILLGTTTIRELSEYGKLLLPVMTSAMASSGGVSSSAAIYGGTAVFSSLLTTIISKFFIPLLYIFLALCVGNRAIGVPILASFQKFIKWLMTWLLKVILYVFTGYIAVSGVVSGSTDAMTVKATKITVSGMIPVVGGIISDASEAILVGAGMMKNAAGIYGIFTFISICIGPITKILIQSIILKIASALCGLFGLKEQAGLVEDFSQGMAMILAATGSICLMLLISTVAFMKGVG